MLKNPCLAGSLFLIITGVAKENFSTYTGGWKLWVLCEKDDILACAALNRNEIRAMFVHPAHQGKGHGKRLLRFLEGYARGMGMMSLFLDSSLNAVGFYSRNGYDAIGENYYKSDDSHRGLRVVRMVKEL